MKLTTELHLLPRSKAGRSVCLQTILSCCCGVSFAQDSLLYQLYSIMCTVPFAFSLHLTTSAQRLCVTCFQVIEKCPVSNILTKENDFGTTHVSGVVTPYGSIKTDCVVNCAGKYSQ